ncbi:MAG: recombinase family protein [Sedimentisphaeraceae bacterium JB056]
MEKQKKIRCAVYTRKSTEEGLEQEFNSLDAQRESAEAYIISQKSQGLVCLDQHYDDGGYTGGNMDRPALNRLLEDIDNGLVDCVVVYKVDRLSRSLMDFAKILEVFERKDISFVSVTQLFNTTNSMGRLTLNILLSFAQFEREVISERTRDKIAMARKRGKYTGGRPVLGYDISPERGKLIVNEAEARTVNQIFEFYLKNRSLLAVADEMEILGLKTKAWVTRKGKPRGGEEFNKKRVQAILKNPLYIGKISYKDKLYDGEHQGIIDKQTFEKTQRILSENRQIIRTDQPNRHGGLLKGLLKCKACGCGMGHSTTKKVSGKIYRYYVCQNAIKRGWNKCPHPSLPASEIERFVIDEVKAVGLDDGLIAEVAEKSIANTKQDIKELKSRLKHLILQSDKENKRLQSMLLSDTTEEQLNIVREQLAITERQISEVKVRLEKLEQNCLNPNEIKEACLRFNPIWDTLTTQEQWQMLKLLLEKVEFDADDESISLTFAPGGIKMLNEDVLIEDDQL